MCLNLAAPRAENNKVLTHGALLQRPTTASREEVTILDTDYADDMALLDNSKDGLQETTDLLCKYAAQAGLRINAKKTEVMAVAKNTTQRPYTEVLRKVQLTYQLKARQCSKLVTSLI